MKLYIPEIGDSIQLSKDWTFNLYMEHRNYSLYTLITGKSHEDINKEINNFYYTNGDNWANFYKSKIISYTFPKDTILKVDRIYIRKGAEDFSSLTFYVTINKKAYRFWAKLEDVNNIEFNNVVVANKKKKFKWPNNIELPTSYSLNEIITKTNNISKIEQHLTQHYPNYNKLGIENIIKNHEVNINNEKYNIKLHKEIHKYQVKLLQHQKPYWMGINTNNIMEYPVTKYKYELLDKDHKVLGSWSTHKSLVKYVNENIIK